MKKSEEQLFGRVFESMMSLPAYKLENQYQKIFNKYRNVDLKKLNRKKTSQGYSTTIYDSDVDNQFICNTYQRPNPIKMLCFSFDCLSSTYKYIGSIAVISFVFAFLVRTSSTFLQLFGGFFLLVFYCSFLIFFIRLFTFYSSVQSTFSKVNRILDDIKDYVFDFGNINENNLDRQANIISKSIIEDEISSLDYDWKKIDILNIVFAFYIAFIFLYILRDNSTEIIKWMASILNFGNSEFIQKLNIESFAFSILFPLGIPLSKYIIVSALQKRNKCLRKSLAIIENRLKERDLSLIKPQELFSERLKFSKEFVQDMCLAAAIHWYQQGKISMEKAAQIADLNRRDFLKALAHEEIDVFTVDFDDLEQELERG